MSTYIVASLPLPLYCGILLLAKQHETKLVSILYCSSMSSSCIILLIIEQLRHPCSSWSSHCNILYPRSLLYLSQWELAKLYSCVVWRGLGTWWLPCHYMTSLSFIAALCWLLWFRHHANFTAAWAAAVTSIWSDIFIVASYATSTLLWDYAPMKAVWDHTRSFLQHHCRLWLRHHADFTCGISADSIRCLIGRLGWSLYCSPMSSCDFHVVLSLYSGIYATSTLLWDYAPMKAVWDHTRSFLRHHCRLWLRHHADFTCSISADSIRRLIGRLAASLPTWVIFILLIDEQLRLPCRLISL
jgi:hypothetical protein